jgi:hypothetical protein
MFTDVSEVLAACIVRAINMSDDATPALKVEKIISPKRWHPPTSLHNAKNQKNIIILSDVKISNLTWRCYSSFLVTGPLKSTRGYTLKHK